MIEKRLGYNILGVHIYFIASQKASDSIAVDKLWYAMRNQGVSKIYINTVQ